MKTTNTILVNLILIAAGVIFILTHARADVLSWIIIATGAIFILPAVVNGFMLSHEVHKQRAGQIAMSPSKRLLGWLCSIGAIILGGVMCACPEIFRSVYVYIFAVAMFFGGCYHLYMFAKALKPANVPVMLYIFPVSLIVAGVVMFFGAAFKDIEQQSTVLLITGIALCVFGVTSLIEAIIAAGHKKRVS